MDLQKSKTAKQYKYSGQKLLKLAKAFGDGSKRRQQVKKRPNLLSETMWSMILIAQSMIIKEIADNFRKRSLMMILQNSISQLRRKNFNY